MKSRTRRCGLVAVSLLFASAVAFAAEPAANRLFDLPEGVRYAQLDEIRAAADAATPSAFPDANSIVVDSIRFEAYERDGTSVVFDDTYTKILTEMGRRSEMAATLGFNAFYSDIAVLAAEIIKPDGTVVTIDLERNSKVAIDTGMMSANIYDPNDKILKVSYPGLEVGDTVRLAIKETVKCARVPGVWSDYQTFESTDPILRYSLYISAPSDLPLAHCKLRGEVPGTASVLEPTELDGGARRLYAWDFRDVPQLFPEPSMPPPHTVCQRLLLSTAQDWNSLSRWYWNLSKPHLDAVTEEMHQQVAALTNGVAFEREKAWRIFTWVSQNIRYMGVTTETEAPGYEPHDASVTFGRRHGVCRDKAALLVSMLRLAGIEAYPVLIHVGEKRDPEVPMTFFNHAIVGVREDDGVYQLMDPTNENSIDFLPGYLAGKSFLVATPEGDTLRTSDEAPASANMLFATSKATVAEDGTITVRSKFEFTGLNDSAYRGALVKFPAERRRKFLEGLAKEAIPGAALKSFSIEPEDLRDTEAPLVIRMECAAPDFVARGNGVDIVDIPRFTSGIGCHNFLLGAIGLVERRFPLETEHACGAEENFEIEFESLGEAVALPDNASFKTNGLTFTQSVFASTSGDSGGGTLKATSRIEFNLTSYPADIYKPFKQTLKEIDRLTSQPAVFAAAPTPEELAADSRILTHTVVIDVTGPGEWTKTVATSRKILTYAGRRAFSELKIPFNPAWQSVELLEASVSNSTGQIMLATDSEINVMDAPWVASAPRYPAGKTMVVSLPGVDVGSTVTTSWQITQTNAPFFSHKQRFNGTSPVESGFLVVKYPAEMADAIRSRGRDVLHLYGDGATARQYTADDGFEALTVSAVNPQTLPQERNLPDPANFADFAAISFGDWREYAASLKAAIDEATSPANSRNCEKLAEKLCEGLDNIGEKIVAIRDYVAKNIRLAGPSFADIPLSVTPADITLAEGYGNLLDRAVLISALLFDAGIDNSIVFAANGYVQTHDLFGGMQDLNGGLFHEIAVPDTDTFTYPLVEIDLDEETWPIYLGDTDQYAVLGMFDHYGRLALCTLPNDEDVEDFTVGDGGKEAPLPIKMLHVNDLFAPYSGRITKVELSANGDAIVTRTAIVDGAGADAVLKKYAEMTPEQLSRHHQEQAGAFSVSAVPVGSMRIETNGLPYSIAFDAKIPGFATRIGDVLSLKLPHASSIHPFGADLRKLPFAVDRQAQTRELLTVKFPQETSGILSRPRNMSLLHQADGLEDFVRSGKVERDEETGQLSYIELTDKSERLDGVFGPETWDMLKDMERRIASPGANLLVIELGESLADDGGDEPEGKEAEAL